MLLNIQPDGASFRSERAFPSGSDPDPAIAVPDLTSTARIKLNERMLLLSIFERIACTTPDNCPVWLNVAKPLGGLQLV